MIKYIPKILLSKALASNAPSLFIPIKRPACLCVEPGSLNVTVALVKMLAYKVLFLPVASL